MTPLRSIPRLAWPLLLLAPVALWLGLTRPSASEPARQGDLPRVLGGFQTVADYPIDAGQARMLGTDDAISRAYSEPDGGIAYLFAVFHREDWKSIHAPETCLRGSDMTLVDETFPQLELGGEQIEVGRLQLVQNQTGQPLVSWYCYLAEGGLRSGSYLDFWLFHAPRALLRSSRPGCLLRIDVRSPGDGVDAIREADRRARALLSAALPQVLQLLR